MKTNTRASRLSLILAYASLIVLSHPFQLTWYDENYTLINFVAHGPKIIFTDYHVPNNHILYSFGLWLWRRLLGDELIVSRLFSLLAATAGHSRFIRGR